MSAEITSPREVLPAQRQVRVPWHDFVLVEDVVLIPFDPQVTATWVANVEPKRAV